MNNIHILETDLDLKQNLNIYTTCKQLDTLHLNLNIYDNGLQAVLTNYNVRLKAMKADKVALIQETGITIVGNIVTIIADEQLTNISGNMLVELQFINKTNGEKKSTFNLVLKVISSILDVNRTISKSTYTLLQELENKLDQASDFFENINEAITSNTNLIASTNTANATKTNLDGSISTANTTKTALDTLNATATDTKNGLNESIINANNSKSNLDTSKANADTSKVALDTSINNANTFVESHGNIIDLDNRVNQNTTQLSEKVSHPFDYGYTIDVTKLDTLEKVRANWAKLKKYINDTKNNEKNTVKFNTLRTPNSVFAEWISGRKCPIGFYSDSTTDGATTTGHVTSYKDDVNFKVVVTESPNAYPKKLEEFMQLLTKETSIPVRCYNGGFDSMAYSGGFGLDYWYNTWFRGLNGSNVDFSDVKMIILGFGTSDSQNINDTATVIDNYSIDLECTIIDCFLRGVQPVVQAPVLTVQRVGSTTMGRKSDESITIIESCQKKLCQKYNLEYFSIAEPLEKALDNFQGLKYRNFIADDRVHPNDQGHRLIASYLANKFNPNIAQIEDGKTIKNLFPGHPSFITRENESISLWQTDNWYICDNSYYYRWRSSDGYNYVQGDRLVRIPVYIEKPTALYYNNTCTSGNIKTLSIKSTVLNITRPQSLVAEQMQQPENIYWSNKSFVTLLPYGLNIIDVFASDDTTEQRLGGFYLADIDEHFNFSLGRGSYMKTLNFDPILTSYTVQAIRQKEPLVNYYNTSDNTPMSVCFRIRYPISLTTTCQIFTHYNDVKGIKDCYNLVEILGDTITLKSKNLTETKTIFTTVVVGLNALLIKDANVRLEFKSRYYNSTGVYFRLLINDIEKSSYQSTIQREIWSDGYGFDALGFTCDNIYITSKTTMNGFVDMETVL